jgi:hypothetical protein
MPLLRKPAQIGAHAKHRLMIGADDRAWDKCLFSRVGLSSDGKGVDFLIL